jgi:amino acid transporter
MCRFFFSPQFLGLVIKLGGCSVKFNYGYLIGFPGFFTSIVFFGLGYIMLGLCMAEMVSVMAFDGGYYGYARVLMGPFGGYLVGCLGLLESFFYFTVFPTKIVQFAEVVFNINEDFEPLLQFCVYTFLFFSFIGIHYKFWNFILFFSGLVILLFLIFAFGSIPFVDYYKYALRHDDQAHASAVQQVEVTPLAVLFFMGFDLVSLTSNEVKNVSSLFSFVWVFILSVSVLHHRCGFSCCCSFLYSPPSSVLSLLS